MALKLNHVHLKTRDPQKTAQFYVDNAGATVLGESVNGGYRLDLHGLRLNVTPILDTQSREQHYGMEHLAVDTDDFPGFVAQLRTNGVRVLEEMKTADGRRVCFFEAPDGVQLEVIEMVKG